MDLAAATAAASGGDSPNSCRKGRSGGLDDLARYPQGDRRRSGHPGTAGGASGRRRPHRVGNPQSMPEYSQDGRPFRVTTPLGDDTLLFDSMKATEPLSG